jgi:hypothetical protein
MGARLDKTESATGVVRAKLAADIASGSWNKILGIGINSSGQAVLGAGQSGIVGVAIFDSTNSKAGQVCDIFKLGEIIVWGTELLVAGTVYTVNTTTGVISSTVAGATQIKVGYTVEADRLVLQGLG